MGERNAVTRELAKRYRKVTKNEKKQILDELCALTGWTRDHARRALRVARTMPPSAVKGPRRRARAPVYGEEVMEPLRRVWSVLGWPCGKRLVAVLPETVRVMERFDEIDVTRAVRDALCRLSAATIDRRLAADRRRFKMKGRSGTKPGTLLKHQIPIRTFADWNDARPGFCEMDLVAHDGGHAAGEFCQTLTVTCVASGWTEPQAVRNKAQRWVFEGLELIRDRLPVALLGVDSDNGSEFINDHMLTWCESEQITFTRTRPYRKNDNCFVEQKNWTHVRQQVGYHRYDTATQLGLLNELYGHLRLYVNFFQPNMKLISKTRDGAKVQRRYDTPQTPYARLLVSPHVPAKVKTALRRQYRTLNPAQLQRDIVACQKKLLDLVARKRRSPDSGQASARSHTPSQSHPWRNFSFGRKIRNDAGQLQPSTLS